MFSPRRPVTSLSSAFFMDCSLSSACPPSYGSTSILQITRYAVDQKSTSLGPGFWRVTGRMAQLDLDASNSSPEFKSICCAGGSGGVLRKPLAPMARRGVPNRENFALRPTGIAWCSHLACGMGLHRTMLIATPRDGGPRAAFGVVGSTLPPPPSDVFVHLLLSISSLPKLGCKFTRQKPHKASHVSRSSPLRFRVTVVTVCVQILDQSCSGFSQ